jgi:hypothetical protein
MTSQFGFVLNGAFRHHIADKKATATVITALTSWVNFKESLVKILLLKFSDYLSFEFLVVCGLSYTILYLLVLSKHFEGLDQKKPSEFYITDAKND